MSNSEYIVCRPFWCPFDKVCCRNSTKRLNVKNKQGGINKKHHLCGQNAAVTKLLLYVYGMAGDLLHVNKEVTL